MLIVRFTLFCRLDYFTFVVWTIFCCLGYFSFVSVRLYKPHVFQTRLYGLCGLPYPAILSYTTMAYRRPFLCRFPQACALVATGLSTLACGSLTLWRRQYAMSFVLSAILIYVQACPASSVRRLSSSDSLKASAPFPQTGWCPCFPLPVRIHKAGWRGRLRALKD